MRFGKPSPLCVWAVILSFPVCLHGDREDGSVNEIITETIAEVETIDLTGEEESGHEWLVAPIPSLNPSLGWTLSVPVAMLYQPGPDGTEAQAWVTGAGGFYAENGSWAGAVFHRMNLFDDRWRLQTALAYADIIYDFYGIGDDSGNIDRFLEINQDFKGGTISALRNIAPNLYFGFSFTGFLTEVKSVRFSKRLPQDQLRDLPTIQLRLMTLTPKLQYDTRDNEFYPTRGSLVNFKVDFSAEAFGSDFDYQIYKFDWNHFRSIGNEQVLALRLAVKYGTDNVPFFLVPAMGQGSDLRGYVPGLYRDSILLAGQAEYRLRVTDRIGVVAFGGVGGVAPEWNEFDEALPSVGLGVRWVLAEKNQVSLRLDVARGKNNTEVYVGVGEAF